MNRLNLLVVAALTAAALCAVPLPVRAADAVAAVPARQALSSRMPAIDVDNVALDKVLKYLRDTSGANLVVNWKGLEAANVTRETPITLKVSDVTLRKVLRLVLDQASPQTQLTFEVSENVIEITTQEAADARMITRVYMVDDLVQTPNTNMTVPQMGLGSTTTVNQGGTSGTSGGGTGTSLFPSGSTGTSGTSGSTGTTTDTTADTNKAGEDLAALVRDVVRPTIWKENGGNASIKYWGGKLIVTAPASVQEAIGGPIPDASRRYGF